MSRTRQTIANLAIGTALLVAASPLSRQFPTPINGVRTALELIAGKGLGKSHVSPRPVPHGTA